MAMETTRAGQGFTLIELSIVLVIIGLLAGGILVGRDLIAAAEIRAQISQLEKYKLAINAFRLKYNGLPGDLKASEAASLGFIARSGTQGRGNGDSIIGSCNTDPFTYIPNIGCEEFLFWADLSSAQMILESFLHSGGDYENYMTLSSYEEWGLYLPEMKLIGAPPGRLTASTYGGNQSLWLVTVRPESQSSSTTSIYTGILFPKDAYAIDSKMDDGMPLNGSVRSYGAGGVGHMERGYYFQDAGEYGTTVSCLSGVNYNYGNTSFARCQLNFMMGI